MELPRFPRPRVDELAQLRAEVRAFLAKELADRPARERAKSWTAFDPGFSRKLADRGWIGMTWPKAYGGHERSAFERYLVQEELLAAGAPVAAHWIADRQSGPLLLRYGTEEQRKTFLPRIAAGECFFCIGMSEPDSGSDLAATRTRAVPVEGGFRVNGAKVWTSHAHEAHFMILFCKTGTGHERHADASQFIVDLRAAGIEIRPIRILSGEHHFNEVVFRDAFLPHSSLVGTQGGGWSQVMSELAFERSGPERFLSSFPLLASLVEEVGPEHSSSAPADIGRLVAQLIVLRQLSRSVAGVLDTGGEPAVEASIVKDIGTGFEQLVPEIARKLVSIDLAARENREFAAAFACTQYHAPSFSLRGGTREILRGIIARGLGLR